MLSKNNLSSYLKFNWNILNYDFDFSFSFFTLGEKRGGQLKGGNI